MRLRSDFRDERGATVVHGRLPLVLRAQDVSAVENFRMIEPLKVINIRFLRNEVHLLFELSELRRHSRLSVLHAGIIVHECVLEKLNSRNEAQSNGGRTTSS